jgi:hypothetical protein
LCSAVANADLRAAVADSKRISSSSNCLSRPSRLCEASLPPLSFRLVLLESSVPYRRIAH